MMKKLLAVALATVITQQAMAVNWVQIDDNFAAKVSIDFDSIQADHLTNGTPVMTAWSQTEFKQTQYLGGVKKYWSNKTFNYFDCRTRKLDGEYIAIYDKQGGVVVSGNNPDFSRYSSANWHRVVPGTTSEAVFNTVCAYAN